MKKIEISKLGNVLLGQLRRGEMTAHRQEVTKSADVRELLEKGLMRVIDDAPDGPTVKFVISDLGRDCEVMIV